MLITDNEHQFTGSRLEQLCEEHKILHHFISMAHPQVDGKAEVTNRTILQGLKRRLGRTNGAWANKLYHVLWIYRTMPRALTRDPFSLSFGIEVVVSVEIGISSARVENYDELVNTEKLHADLDLLEEVRERAHIRMAAYQH